MTQDVRDLPLNSVLDPLVIILEIIWNSLMDLTIIAVCCSPVWRVTYLTKTLLAIRPLLGASLLTFFLASAAFADLKREIPTLSPTRIKRQDKVQKSKPSGYHNRDGSPSREGRDEYYLLVPEEPKTDDERDRRKVEATQLPKILSVLKSGNFAKAQQMLSDLARTMPIDSQSRYCYERLAAMCADRMDTEYWYRYDIKEIRHAKEARKSIADLPHEDSKVLPPSSSSVHSLRKEAWLLLTAGSEK